MANLHPKIQELRRKAPFTFRSEVGLQMPAASQVRKMGIDTSKRRTAEQLRDEGRIGGYLLGWNNRDSWHTVLLEGSADKSIRERGPGATRGNKLKFLWQHDVTDPLGGIDFVESDSYGLYIETTPLDDSAPNSARALAQVASGTLEGLSGGFNPVWDNARWDDTLEAVVFPEIELIEGSIVTFNSNDKTLVTRSKEAVDTLHDDAEYFIRSLPRSAQHEARILLTRYQSLIQIEPDEAGADPLKKDKPKGETRGIDYQYLLTNLKF